MRLEPERQTADDPLGRADDEELVVERLIGGGFTEEIVDREQHFPPGGAEIHEWQRLAHLDVESGIDPGVIAGTALAAGRGMREAVADAVQEEHARRGLRHFGFHGGRDILNPFGLQADGLYRRGHPMYMAVPGQFTKTRIAAAQPMDRIFFGNADSGGPESLTSEAIRVSKAAVEWAELVLAGKPGARAVAEKALSLRSE